MRPRCDYAKYGQTHASMTIATSTDYGLTWKMRAASSPAPILRSAGKETGDSCVSVRTRPRRL